MNEQRHRTRHEHQQRRQTIPGGGRFAQRPAPGVAHSREQQQADRRQDAQARPGRDAPRRASAQRQIVRRLAGRNQPCCEGGRRRVSGRRAVALEQKIDRHAEQLAELDQPLRVGHRLPGFPLGHRLTGDVQPRGQLLLRPSGRMAQAGDIL